MLNRFALWAALAMSGSLLAAAPASASLSSVVSAGHGVASRLQANTTTCQTLGDADSEHLGEYVMARMVGAEHEAINARMSKMLGATDGERIHALMGRSYAACATPGAGAMVAPGVMRAGPATSGIWRAMMNLRGYSWMHDGTWQHMSRDDWHAVAVGWMGPGMMSGGHDGWVFGGTVGLIAAALILAALVIVVGVVRPWRRRPTPPSPT